MNPFSTLTTEKNLMCMCFVLFLSTTTQNLTEISSQFHAWWFLLLICNPPLTVYKKKKSDSPGLLHKKLEEPTLIICRAGLNAIELKLMPQLVGDLVHMALPLLPAWIISNVAWRLQFFQHTRYIHFCPDTSTVIVKRYPVFKCFFWWVNTAVAKMKHAK